MGKKLLKTFSTMIALCLLMAMFSISALAATATSLPTADEDGVITLVEDVTIDSGFPTSGTIDLNGYTLTYTGTESVTISATDSLTITDSTGEGTLVMDPGITNSTCYFAAEGSLTLENITVTSTGSVVYAKGDGTDTSPSTVVIDNCYISTTGVYCVGTNASASNGTSLYSGVDITITNSILMTEATDGDDCTVMINVEGNLAIENSYIVGDRQAVVVRAGTATITDSILVVTGEHDQTSYLDSDWKSGNEVPSAALVAGNYNSTYYGDADVTVTDSTITSLSDDSAAIYAESNKETVSGASELYTSTVTLTGDDTSVVGKVTTGRSDESDITVYGGTYDSDVSKYLDDSVEAVVLVAGEEEGSVSSYSYYTSVTAAIQAAGTEDTVALISEDESGCAHTYVYSDTLREATCAKAGLDKWVCSECGATIYVTVTVEHEYEITECTVTCQEDGEITYTCSVCGDTYTEEVEASDAYHQYDEDEAEIVEATCGEKGSISYTCTICGEEVTEVIDATGEHTWVEDSVKDATCTENMKVGTICSVCGAEGDDVTEIADTALGHEYEYEIVDVTCTEDEHILYTCTRCGDTYTDTFDDAEKATGHNYEEKEVDATCSSYAYTVYTCANCGDTYTEETGTEYDADNHSAAEVTLTLRDADCSTEKNGLVKMYCSDCDESWYEVIAYEHDYEITETDATCEVEGTTTYTCSVCGKTYTVDGEKIDHDYQVTDSKEATCEDGYIEYTCTMCGKSYTEILDAVDDHTWVEDQVVDATCTENEKVGTVCSVCGAEGDVTEIADTALGHDYDYEIVDATCTEGEKIVYTCTRCGDTYEEETGTQAALGHTWVEETVEAACSTEGYTKFVCSVCGVYDDYEEILDIDEDAHVYVETTLREATCSKAGIVKKTCSLCGAYTYESVTVEHTWDEGVVTTEATCTEDGVMTYTCTVCGETETEAIEATGHEYGEELWSDDGYVLYQVCEVCGDINILWEDPDADTESTHIFSTTITEATCTEDGEIVYTCALHEDCTANHTEIIEATGHEYDDGVITQEATCTDDGVITYTCGVCGDTYTETIAATGHTEGEAVVENYVAPTETEDGSYDSVVYCTVCGAEISRETITVPATGCEHTYEATLDLDTLMEDEYGDMYVTVTLTCEDCGDTVTIENVIVTSETTAPTCTEEGETVVTAVVNYEGVEYTAVETIALDPLGHTYVLSFEYVDGVGVFTYTCTECGDSYTI